jgi:hypothetical protein
MRTPATASAARSRLEGGSNPSGLIPWTGDELLLASFMARGELGDGDGAVGSGIGTIGVGDGAAALGPAAPGATPDRSTAGALAFPPCAPVAGLDPPFAGVVPDPLVGVVRTAPAPSGSARAPASATTGRATAGTDEGTWSVVLEATDEMFAIPAAVAGTSEAVDPSTSATGTLPDSVWTVGNDGRPGSVLAPAG